MSKDAYYAAGTGGQFAFIVPSHQLVVVPLGHSSGSWEGTRALSTALRLLTSTIRTTEERI